MLLRSSKDLDEKNSEQVNQQQHHRQHKHLHFDAEHQPTTAAATKGEKTKRRFTISTPRRKEKEKEKQQQQTRNSPISAFLLQETQILGALSLPNLDDAIGSPKTTEKLEAYRWCLTSSASTTSTTTHENSDAKHSDVAVEQQRQRQSHANRSHRDSSSSCSSADDAHAHFIEAGKASSFHCHTSDTGGSTSDRTGASSWYTDSGESRAFVRGEYKSSLDSRYLNTHSSLAAQDVKARSVGNEIHLSSSGSTATTTATANTTMSDIVANHALAKNLEPAFRQRLFTAPPAMMRPHRRAFRLKSGQRSGGSQLTAAATGSTGNQLTGSGGNEGDVLATGSAKSNTSKCGVYWGRML